MPRMMSMPPEKSAYCQTEYRRIPNTTMQPGRSAMSPESKIAAIAGFSMSATVYFFTRPNSIRSSARSVRSRSNACGAYREAERRSYLPIGPCSIWGNQETKSRKRAKLRSGGYFPPYWSIRYPTA